MAVTNTDISRTLEWLHKFHATGDSLDALPWMTFFTPTAILNYANNPPLKGHEEIAAAMGTAFGGLECMQHEIGEVHVTPDRVYQEATITYMIRGDPAKETLKVNGFAVFHKGVHEERVSRFDVYGDFSEVYKRM